MLGSVKLTLPDGTTTLSHCVLRPLLCNGVGRSTCGRVRLGDGVDPVHGQRGVVLLLPLQGEHHLRQGVGDPPPLQDQPGQRVQRPKLLQNVLPKK